MEEDSEVLEPYQLSYSDLLSLSSSSSSSTLSLIEMERLKSVTKAVMEALGPTGPGLLAITGVPNVGELRNSLLPRARSLSLLPDLHRKRILKDHGLGSDVPLKNLDRSVSSFAMQLKYDLDFDLSKSSHLTSEEDDDKSMNVHFKDLGYSFRELGLRMMDLGLAVARICDRSLGGNQLENSLLESGTAKARLIHYHSSLDTTIIKHSVNNAKLKSNRPCRIDPMHYDANLGNLWQQWHYDYGTFTVLTTPMFITPICHLTDKDEDDCAVFGGLECLSPCENTYLQIFHPNKNRICSIKAPPGSFILQVGESADILSRHKLRATLHSVLRPVELTNLSRETFVVFLHPAWNKVFDVSDYPMEQLGLEHKERPQGDDELKKLTQEIHKIIPPLSARLKDGMTFAEFSRETTKQYFGGNGLQSNR